MFVTITGPAGYKEEGSLDTLGLALGQLPLIGAHHDQVELCFVNGKVSQNWRNFIPQRADHVDLVLKPGDFFFTPAALASAAAAISTATGVGVTAATVGMLINTMASMLISLGLSMIMRALSPTPKAFSTGPRYQAFGISGFNNTTGQGTPKFVPWGLNRIAGHVISSSIDLAADGRSMEGSVLYFMGATGGDGINSISDVYINDLPISQYAGVEWDWRPGTNDQSVIAGFENVSQVYTVGLTIPDTAPTTAIPWTQKTQSDIDAMKLMFFFPGGLFKVNTTGKVGGANVTLKIEQKRHSDTVWVECPNSPVTFSDATQGDTYKNWEVRFPEANQWDVRVSMIGRTTGVSASVNCNWFNVQEIQFTTRTYPGSALLSVSKIPAKQIGSFQSMRVTALQEGKLVKVWDGAGFNLMFTRQRAWILRDMITNPKVGMGYEYSEDEIDDAQWKADAQDYWDEMVPSHPGEPDEVRDYCDVVVNEAEWDWDVVKKVAMEGRARIYPSGDKWRLVVDKPMSGSVPDMLYSAPGNIIEDSIQLEVSLPDKPFTQIIGEFRNAEADYAHDVTPPIVDPEALSVVEEDRHYDTITRESQVQRENMIAFKKSFLERRRWSFLSPMSALPDEPLSLAYMAERFPSDEGPLTGFLPSDCTTTEIFFKDLILIKGGETYTLIVKRAKDNVLEERLVTTGAGNWGSVTVATPYTQAPAEGDLYALCIVNVENVITRAQDLEIDDQGRIRQIRTEYIPSVYTQDPLPPKSARRYFHLLNLPPIPLRDAFVTEEIVVTRDGTQMSTLKFSVVPGLTVNSGKAQAGYPSAIALAANEPAAEGYYTEAYISIVDGTGAGQIDRRITSYSPPGASYLATIYPAWTIQPDSTSIYKIEWKRFGEYLGFVVRSDDGVSGFVEMGRPAGVVWERNAKDQIGQITFEFTPYGPGNLENRIAPIIKTITLQGDRSAPQPPNAVTLSSHLKNVSIDIRTNRPTSEDLAGFDVRYWGFLSGAWELLREVSVPVPQDNATSGVMVRQHLESFDAYDYGTQIHAHVRAYDYSDNKTDWVYATNQITLQPITTPDIGPSALTDYVEFSLTDPDTERAGHYPTYDQIATVSLLASGAPIFISGIVELAVSGSPTGIYAVDLMRGDDHASGLVLDTCNISTSVNPAIMPFQKVDWPPAGTYTYKFWLQSQVTYFIKRCRLLALEIKDHTL
jgi:hypothetical protein